MTLAERNEVEKGQLIGRHLQTVRELEWSQYKWRKWCKMNEFNPFLKKNDIFELRRMTNVLAVEVIVADSEK